MSEAPYLASPIAWFSACHNSQNFLLAGKDKLAGAACIEANNILDVSYASISNPIVALAITLTTPLFSMA